MKVVTAAQMAAIEQAADRSGVTLDTLMENAGLAVAQAARDDLGGVAGARVVILVGPGNNGADGLVVARHLRRWGAEVACCLLTRRPEHDPKLDLAREYGVQILSSPDGDTLQRLLCRSRMVIDAILGTGRSRPLDGPVRDAMLTLQRIRPQPGHPELVEGPPLLLALDLPTGLNPDTGEVDPACPLRHHPRPRLPESRPAPLPRRRTRGPPASAGHRHPPRPARRAIHRCGNAHPPMGGVPTPAA